MKMTKECHRQVIEAVKNLIKQCDQTDEEIAVKRIWRRGDTMMVRYFTRREDDMDMVLRALGGGGKIANVVGFHLCTVMEEKKRLFGSGSISYA